MLLVDDRFRQTWTRRRRLAFPLASVVSTGRGPTGVPVLGPRDVYVHERFDRTVFDLDYRALRRNLQRETDQGSAGAVDDTEAPTGHTATLPLVGLGDSTLDPDLLAGRSLFHDAISPELGSAGVACSTCHVDGRTDGLTWTLRAEVVKIRGVATGVLLPVAATLVRPANYFSISWRPCLTSD